jgi:hypothetical protein
VERAAITIDDMGEILLIRRIAPARGLSDHAHDLVAIRIDANGIDVLAAQVLDQALA